MASRYYGELGPEGPFINQPDDGHHYVLGFEPYARNAYKYTWRVGGIEYFAGKVMESEYSCWHIRWFLGCWNYDGSIEVVNPKIGGVKDGKRRTGYGVFENRIPRDSQRQKVYDAEQYAIRPSVTNRSRSPEEICLWIQQTLKEDWFQANFPEVSISGVNVQVSNKNFRTSSANRTYRRIKLAAGWGQKDDVVIHELAHIVHDDDPRDPVTRKRQSSRTGKKQAAHGPEYCAHYIYLLEMMGHPDWAHTLSAQFQTRGVKVCPTTLATLRRRGEERFDFQYAATRG